MDEASLAELTELQSRLFGKAASLVRPGGTVVYSTCSLLREEGEEIVAAAGELGLEPAPSPIDGLELPLRLWPHRDETDGFFVARFTKVGP